MPSVAVVLEYVGTAYRGYQVQEKQAGGLTIQGEVERALFSLTGERIRIEYMKRLITPRSQRRIIGTVLPSIVVVWRIDAAGGGAAGSYGRYWLLAAFT